MSSKNRTMTKNPSQKLKIPALPKVRHRKGMPESVGREADAGNTQLDVQGGEIAFQVADRDFRIILRPKDTPFQGMINRITIQRLAQFKAKGYEPVFSTLADDLDDQVVKIHICRLKRKNLTRPKARITDSKRNKVSADKVKALREVAREYKELGDIARGKCS